MNFELLCSQIRALGIEEGDSVYVRADLGEVINNKQHGATQKFKPVEAGKAFIRAIRRVIGESGTILAPAFTRVFIYPFVDKSYAFDPERTPPITGGLSTLLLKEPEAKRSCHPVASFVAVGKNADYFLEGHDENALTYLPIKKLIEYRGKMLLCGCIDSSPGFTTVHLAQELLGLSKKSLLGMLMGVFYLKKGERRYFCYRSMGGCSLGFYKFYSLYNTRHLLASGFIGGANSICINAEKAFEIEYATLKADPRFPLCENPRCFFCRGSLLYNLKDMPRYYCLVAPKKLALSVFGRFGRKP